MWSQDTSSDVFVLLSLLCACAVATCLLGYPLCKLLLRLQLLDQPNLRSSHNSPTPRGGGIAIVGVLVPCYAILGLIERGGLPLTLAAGGLMLAVISFLDDCRGVPARVRFVFHFLAACILLATLMKDDGRFQWSAGTSGIVVVSLLWVVGYTNAYNFMDGINGIAGVQAFITGIGTAIVAGEGIHDWSNHITVMSTIVAGCAAGFLPHNFPKARMFMGDVGSAPLGFVLAGLALAAVFLCGPWSAVPLLLLHANYILDTCITMVRRFLRGERLYEAHKEHFYQRIVRAGASHTFTTLCELVLQALTLLLCVAYLRTDGLLLKGFIVSGALAIWSGFFGFAELQFRRSARSTLPRPNDIEATASRHS